MRKKFELKEGSPEDRVIRLDVDRGDNTFNIIALPKISALGRVAKPADGKGWENYVCISTDLLKELIDNQKEK